MNLLKVPFGTKFKIVGCKNPGYLGRTVVYTDKSKFMNDTPHFFWEPFKRDAEDWDDITPVLRSADWDDITPVLRSAEFKEKGEWYVELEPLKKVKRKVV